MTIRREDRGAIAVVTIDRPEVRNALDLATTDLLRQTLASLDEDPAVRAVILTGAGDRAFSAGADLRDAKRLDAGTKALENIGRPPRPFSKPLLAAVNGYAYGGGLELMLSCDLTVAAPHARFAIAEAKRGLLAAGGGLVRLARRIPLAIALEMAMTGEPIDAQRALALGLVNRIDDDALAAAVTLAESVLACSPVAVRLSKHVMYTSVSSSDDETWRVNREAMLEMLASEDFREGPRAFVEKRAPDWPGR